MFKFIGGMIGRMFGSPAAIENTIQSTVRGLDSLIYTDQEKAEEAAKDRAAARAMLIEWLDKTQGQSLARRFLAMVMTFTWLFQYFMAMALNISVVWVSNPATIGQLTGTAQIVSQNADGMTGAMMLIMGFYFAAPHLDKFIEPAMGRFGGQPK